MGLDTRETAVGMIRFLKIQFHPVVERLQKVVRQLGQVPHVQEQVVMDRQADSVRRRFRPFTCQSKPKLMGHMTMAGDMEENLLL